MRFDVLGILIIFVMIVKCGINDDEIGDVICYG